MRDAADPHERFARPVVRRAPSRAACRRSCGVRSVVWRVQSAARRVACGRSRGVCKACQVMRRAGGREACKLPCGAQSVVWRVAGRAAYTKRGQTSRSLRDPPSCVHKLGRLRCWGSRDAVLSRKSGDCDAAASEDLAQTGERVVWSEFLRRLEIASSQVCFGLSNLPACSLIY